MSLQNQQAEEPYGLWKIEAISVVQEQETIYNILYIVTKSSR